MTEISFLGELSFSFNLYIIIYKYVHTLLLQSLGSVRFFYVFERSLLYSPNLHLFDQKYSKTPVFSHMTLQKPL